MSANEEGSHQTFLNQQQRQNIDKWEQERIQLIKQIATKSKNEEDNQSDEDRQGSTNRSTNIAQLLDEDLGETIFGHIGGGSFSQSKFIPVNDQKEEDDDDSVSSTGRNELSGVHPLSPSQQLSIDSRISESAGQAVSVKMQPTRIFCCYKDNETGIMAINGNQLVYVDSVKGPYRMGKLTMRVAPNLEQSNEYHNIVFPNIGDKVRVVDMEYWPSHGQYILGIITTTETIRSSGLCLFNPALIESDKAIQKWIPCEQGYIIARVCCTSTTIYEIVRNHRKNFLILLNQYGTLKERKPAEDLFPFEPMTSCGGLRLADISCSLNNDRLAVAYNCSDGERKGPIGAYVFDPTKDWMLIGRVDLGQTNIEFNVPRLVFLNKTNLFAALNSRNGYISVFNVDGEPLGKRSFIFLVSEYEEDQPVIYPFNICSTQHWAAIRYNRIITIHRIND